MIRLALVELYREDGGPPAPHWPDGHIPADDLGEHGYLFDAARSALDKLRPVAQTA